MCDRFQRGGLFAPPIPEQLRKDPSWKKITEYVAKAVQILSNYLRHEVNRHSETEVNKTATLLLFEVWLENKLKQFYNMRENNAGNRENQLTAALEIINYIQIRRTIEIVKRMRNNSKNNQVQVISFLNQKAVKCELD